jgi:tetratricopeptide (TPR) repeat protein
MTETRSLFENLMHRRVPQIAGMYIAAMWLVIELGDWVTERFGLPGNLTSFVFVAMLVMLPSILLVAYNHGAPGRDRWTRAEKFLVPGNAALTVLLLWFMTPVIDVEAATETLTIQDETGAVQEFEVARRGYHREIVSFFWVNETGNEELDWLSYGLPIMLAHDLNRVSPVITADTPIDSPLLMRRLREQGYDRFLGVPGGLAVELGRERQSDALVVGSFSEDGALKIVSVRVIDAASGETLETFTTAADSWMAGVDAVTAAVLGTWEITPAENHSDDPVSEHFSNSLDAVRHFVRGEIAIDIDGDYPRGMAEYDAALVIDPAFAEARSELSVRQYLSGDLVAARESAALALRNSYRLSTSSEFVLKANRYIYDGDYDRGERVLEIWTEVEPNSTRALQNVAQLLRVRGTSDSLEKALSAYDRLLQLRPNDYSIYRQQAEVEQQRGDTGAAIALLLRYLEFDPDSGPALNQLAGLYQAQGDLEAAQATLEDAAILMGDPLGAELGLIRLEARRGLFDDSVARLEGLLDDELLPQQELQALVVAMEIAVARGRIAEAMALCGRANQLAENLMPPAQRIISIEGQKAAMLMLLGRFDEALAAADEVAAKLQPPLNQYMNFSYTSIHAAAGNRDEFRRWAQASRDARDQLPQFFAAIMALEQAQISIWDGDLAAAVTSIDSASAMLGQSILQVLLDSLSVSDLFVDIARLYLEAGATGKARAQLEAVLRVYPGNARAKFMLARTLIADGDADNARLFLEDAIELWSKADDEFRYLRQAREVMSLLET